MVPTEFSLELCPTLAERCHQVSVVHHMRFVFDHVESGRLVLPMFLVPHLPRLQGSHLRFYFANASADLRTDGLSKAESYSTLVLLLNQVQPPPSP